MQIGVFADSPVNPAALAKKAEEAGFESFWVPEQVFMPLRVTTRYRGAPEGEVPEFFSRMPDPFVTLAMAAAATTTIKLGTGICIVPERSPLLLAKEAATLDLFSGGRFLFGIGAGWLKEETEIMGADWAHRWTQTREAVLAMKELWARDGAEYHGEYYDFPPVRSLPRPVQRPHPPIILGGYARSVFKRVVEWGDGWIPSRVSAKEMKEGRDILDDLAVKAGRNPGSIQIVAFGHPGRFHDRGSIEELEDTGVDRVTVWLDHAANLDDAFREIDQLARELLR